MSEQLTRRRFSVDEYHRMAEVGLLTEDDRVELINGEIVEMAPIGSLHASCVLRLNHLLSQWLGERALVSVQNPLRLSSSSEPQPNIALLRPRPDFYRSAHPAPADVLLVVEVCDTTGTYDRQIKRPLYARAAIPEAWLAALDGGLVEAHRSPRPEGYSEVHILRRGDTVSPQAFPDIALAVSEVLGDA